VERFISSQALFTAGHFQAESNGRPSPSQLSVLTVGANRSEVDELSGDAQEKSLADLEPYRFDRQRGVLGINAMRDGDYERGKITCSRIAYWTNSEFVFKRRRSMILYL
jgi:hypothetical protein